MEVNLEVESQSKKKNLMSKYNTKKISKGSQKINYYTELMFKTFGISKFLLKNNEYSNRMIKLPYLNIKYKSY